MKPKFKFGHKKLYIAGQLTEASNGKTFEVICPADEKPTATIAWASKEDTQRALNAAGYNAGSPDGVMGVRTQSALKQFQNDKGLPIGNLNLETLKALGVSAN